MLRAQLNNVLDLLLPGDGHDLLPLHGQDWPALKDRVTGWMAEELQGQVYGRRLRQSFGSGARRVDVEAEHLLGDYWWVTATPAGTHPDYAAMDVTAGRHPAENAPFPPLAELLTGTPRERVAEKVSLFPPSWLKGIGNGPETIPDL